MPKTCASRSTASGPIGISPRADKGPIHQRTLAMRVCDPRLQARPYPFDGADDVAKAELLKDIIAFANDVVGPRVHPIGMS